MKARIVFALVAASMLSGCATLQPSQGELYEIEIARDESVGQQTIDNNRGLDPIRGKMPLFGISGITFQMLANTAKPTDIERAAILELGKVTDDYVLRANQLSARHGDPYLHTAASIWASDRALLADLYNGALTYAEYAKRRQEIATTFNDAYERERSRFIAHEEAHIEAQGEQEAQMRRALIFQNYLNQNPLFQRR